MFMILFLRCEFLTTILVTALDLSTIPDFDDYDLSLLSSKMNFYDHIKTRNCFSSKYILLLGDSTMNEFTDDLVLLLTGIANKTDEALDYLYKSTHTSRSNTSPTTLNLPGNVSVEYHNFHRNMTVFSPILDTYIRYRFTGSWDIFDNFDGVQSLNDPRFKEELDWMLTHRDGRTGMIVQAPDVIILNSCHHDAGHNIMDFEHSLDLIFKYLTSKVPTATIVWKSTLIFPHQHQKPNLFPFDVTAARIAHNYNVSYVNTTYAYYSLLNGHLAGKEFLFTRDFIHFGSIAKFRNPTTKMTISSFMTQVVLDSFCNGTNLLLTDH